MPGIANERSFSSLIDRELRDGVRDGLAVSGSHAPEAPRAPLQTAKRLLDGVNGLGWSVIGFLGGAVFWHFIGFWSFVSHVVLAGGPQPNVLAHAVERPHWVRTADAAAAVPGCTALVLDRRTGTTSARACDTSHAPLPADAFEGREDRIVAMDMDEEAAALTDIEIPLDR